jgi:predicted ATP-dependent endonuclease of OLD family
VKITSIQINNFRKLWRCKIDFSKGTTLFVGANNSGKTSAMDALGRFLAGRDFVFNDFTISNREAINAIGNEWANKEAEMPTDLSEWEKVLPRADVWLDVGRNEIHYVANIIPTLKWRGGKLGVRIIYQPKDVSKFFVEYREAYFTARDTEAARGEKAPSINLFPKNLCDFVEKKLSVHFSIKSYVLDHTKADADPAQPTPFDMECFTDNPLKGIVRVDMIDAQRGFADPDSTDIGEKTKQKLSSKMRNYYDKHLDPEKAPSPEDLSILEATEAARSIFDKGLATKFSSAIEELEGLGYPGMTDPKITISTKVNTSETLRHESAVQYALSKNNEDMKLPEKYNGLGYQNLISMVFDLMGFRDAWMRIGKAAQRQGDESVIEPLHLVLVEEPEVHLHMQVQQVFIREAYAVLRNREPLKDKCQFATQLVISTHSSHIARETDFANLRYFKRLPETKECAVSTAEVINLSDVFGKEDATDKFVTRYLQTTHCDLFFADAAILVEGSAESMLLPHFIRNKYRELHQRYISILSINGRHSHRLSPLIDKLCLPTLIIADLDSAESTGYHIAALPERGKGLISGNYAVSSWILNEKSLDVLLDLKKDQKVLTQKSPYEYSMRIVYQTPLLLEYKGKQIEALTGTFEDSVIYSNLELFKTVKVDDDTGGLIKKVQDEIKKDESFERLHAAIYKLLRNGKSDQKAEFALDLIFAIDPDVLTIPTYIAEGLEWLQDLLKPEDA